MISIDLPANMACVEPSCGRIARVQLLLLTTGTLAFQPTPEAKGWQVGTGGPGSPYICRCPAHHQTVTPAGPRLITSEH